MGHKIQVKKCLRTCTKCEDLDHPVYAQSINLVFALHSYIISSLGLCPWRAYVVIQSLASVFCPRPR